ncbi:MAG: tail fiber domain-containing protein, partial [Bacteroidota bacterium]
LQIISISNDTIYLTNGGYAIIPAGFSGDYNDLANAPLNLTDFTNDAGFIIDPTDADADPTNELQILSISNDTLYLSGGNSLYLENLSDTSYWERIGDNLYYDLGNVSVGSNIVNPSGRLQVTSDPTAGVNDVIFSVLNADGDTVFAVYQEGVRIWVNDDGSKATGNRGGFAVGGFSPSKNTTNEYLRVTPDSVRVYIEEGSGTKATGNRGGFAVGGFSPSKSFTDYYFNVEYSDDAEIIDPSTPRLLWYPQREALLSGKVLILHPDSVGTNSFTSGYESRAKGNWSHALGYKAIARGNYSTSIGKYSKAYGENSFAFGDSAKTLNRDSYAFGAGAVTEGKGCYAFGAVMRNSDGTPTSLFTKAVGDYSLALGFGAESNGFMSIAFGSRAISTGDYSMVFGYEAEASGIWAMALGDNTHATGYFSLAMGTFTTASGNASTAFGRGCEASGSTSVAGGVDCIATGQGSVALGDRARAQGFYYSTAFGGRTTASGKGAFAAGDTTIASGDYSVAIGASNISSAMSSTSFGSSNIASGFAAMALNSHTDASGMMATAMGLETDAQSYASLVIGRYNTIAGSANSWVATDPIFVIGTGSTPGARKNAMTVLKNGEVYMPDVYTDAVGVTNLPLYIDNTGKLGYLSSSRRYKKNIIDMENVDWLYNLRPVNFYYKNDNENILQYGLIAEEVELVNPKFVIYSSDGKIETVQYNNLISPMLKALQNQNAKISKQECEIIDLKKRISDMENLLKINSKK